MISAFLAFQDSVVSWKARNCTPQKPGKARKVRKKWSTLSWLSPMCKKARQAWNDSLLSWLFRILRFPGKPRILHPKSLEKPRKAGRNWSTLSWLSPMCKKRGKPGMTPCFPGFSGFCAFLKSPEFYTPKAWKSQEIQEEMVHAFLVFPMCKKAHFELVSWNLSIQLNKL